MDAFYASVEQRDRPELRGRPVAVGGSPTGRGVVAAASYEARKFGVRSAIPMARAIRLCPDLEIVRPDFQKYRAVSQQVFAIYRSVTPLVEPLSLDEAYLDVTENAWGEPLGVTVARRIKQLIVEATGLTASAGVAPNKFLAKVASAWRKPNGLTVIAPERVESFLRELPVDALWGVGPVTASRLHEHGITHVVHVRDRPLADLHAAVGSLADWLVELAHGRDDRPVEPNRPSKSSSSECTYTEDLTDIVRIREELDEMARENAAWLQEHGPGRADGDHQGAVRGLHHDHAQPLGGGHRRRGGARPAGAAPARKDRCRTSARAPARRWRPQLRRRRGPRRRAGEAAVRVTAAGRTLVA